MCVCVGGGGEASLLMCLWRVLRGGTDSAESGWVTSILQYKLQYKKVTIILQYNLHCDRLPASCSTTCSTTCYK